MVTSVNPQHGPGWGDPLGFNAGCLNSVLPGGLVLTDNLWTPAEQQHPEWYPLGTAALGTLPLGYYPIKTDLEALRVYSGDYRLELRDPYGTLLYALNDWSGATWDDAVNEPGSLVFSYPRDTEEADCFVYPNEVYLYRGKAIYPERSFTVAYKRMVDEEPRTVEVTCEGLLAQWGREVIRSWNNGTGSTVGEILAAWVYGYQLISPGIYIGTIDPSIKGSILLAAAENKTLLAALQDLQAIYGGYYYVTAQRRLCWSETIGNDLGHVIRFGKNATSINREIDYRTINNRLIVTGSVSGTDTTVVVNDTDSQALYGIQTGYYTAPDVVTLSDLNKLAASELTRRAQPTETITAGVIDLSHTDDYDYEFEALAMDPGSKVSLVSKESETAISCRVYRVTRSLDNPLQVQIEVGDATGGVGTTVSYRPKQNFISAVANLVKYVQSQKQGSASTS